MHSAPANSIKSFYWIFNHGQAVSGVEVSERLGAVYSCNT